VVVVGAVAGQMGLDPRAIVGGENDKRSLVEVESLEGSENFADRPIDFLNHIAIEPAR
jgi:hypothetical protein